MTLVLNLSRTHAGTRQFLSDIGRMVKLPSNSIRFASKSVLSWVLNRYASRYQIGTARGTLLNLFGTFP